MTEKYNMFCDKYEKEFCKKPSLVLICETDKLMSLKITDEWIIDDEISKIVYICKSIFPYYMGYGIYKNDDLVLLIMLK